MLTQKIMTIFPNTKGQACVCVCVCAHLQERHGKTDGQRDREIVREHSPVAEQHKHPKSIAGFPK